MIHDPQVEVSCDGDGCRESIYIEPKYVYRDYSGRSGYYDCSNSAIEKLLIRDGWKVEEDGDDGEDNKHFCESCAEAK